MDETSIESNKNKRQDPRADGFDGIGTDDGSEDEEDRSARLSQFSFDLMQNMPSAGGKTPLAEGKIMSSRIRAANLD